MIFLNKNQINFLVCVCSCVSFCCNSPKIEIKYQIFKIFELVSFTYMSIVFMEFEIVKSAHTKNDCILWVFLHSNHTRIKHAWEFFKYFIQSMSMFYMCIALIALKRFRLVEEEKNQLECNCWALESRTLYNQTFELNGEKMG